MSVADIISLIDAQILRLKQARSVLVDASAPVKGHGKPKVALKAAPAKKAMPVKAVEAVSTPAPPAPAPIPVKRAKRALSPEGRERIKEAQRQRWAERKKDTVSQEPAKPVASTPSALSGAVPAGPVAVSAEEVRKAEARRAQIEAAHHAEPTANDWVPPKPSQELTIDMLFKDLSDNPKSSEETSNVN